MCLIDAEDPNKALCTETGISVDSVNLIEGRVA
jgi:hypothetical protein